MPPSGTCPPEVASMILSGASNAEIARALGVATSTVRHHRTRLGAAPAPHPGPRPARGTPAKARSIRLTDEEVRAFDAASDGAGWSTWLRDLGRKAAGIE